MKCSSEGVERESSLPPCLESRPEGRIVNGCERRLNAEGRRRKGEKGRRNKEEKGRRKKERKHKWERDSSDGQERGSMERDGDGQEGKGGSVTNRKRRGGR